jgi:hypothetical protein
MSGRWYTWFLEKGLTKEQEAAFYRDVQDYVAGEAWHALRGLAINTQLWDEADQYLSLSRSFGTTHDPFQGERVEKPHIREWTGKVQDLHWKDKKVYFRVQLDEGNVPVWVDIPLEAIVSTRSTGFPKVAYNPEQFLYFELKWIVSLQKELGISTHPELEAFLGTWTQEERHARLFPKNFRPKTWELAQASLDPNTTIDGVFINQWIQAVIEQMEEDIPSRCKPPYHHVLEWNFDDRILQFTHPIIDAYQQWRKRYPNIVPGRAFIPIP